MTRLTELANYLRKRSGAYGGIPHYLTAAGDIEKAVLAFVREQTFDNLTALNGAVARANRFKLQAEGHAARGPEVA